jgi:hypothetical protein
MSKQTVGIGSTADDGTGDSLRTGGDKINDNFTEIYTKLSNVSGSATTLPTDDFVLEDATQTLTNKTITGTFTGNVTGDVTGNVTGDVDGTTVTTSGDVNVGGSIVFEGATDDAAEITLTPEDPSTDRTLTLPAEDGKLSTQGFSIAVSVALG